MGEKCTWLMIWISDQPGQQHAQMQDMGPLSLMPYFSATLARALQPVQHGQQVSALHQGKQPPRPALSMAAPKMHEPPKHIWQQQAMPQSLTMWQLQILVSHFASAITERLAMC